MFEIALSSRFKKDLKTAIRRGYDMSLLGEVVNRLAAGETLDERHRDHELSGNYSGFRECHISSDWLLIYRIVNHDLILLLTRTGTHSDLF